ncbi:uncharacterized protein LOC104584528 isoform X2 [Brachypodium distachyon]|uniref:Uncharacterized protein n=1 Tax=Brachypodium distachyon TaxID=15368 RepID=A0A0Q3PFS7_BRADI|nr:uncharacterized protein LOC104584528 isoform X2 [Brachypodium distachyon]KQJ88217.1 hypothetical protein BRADI_4g16443v3 [Brachypodium distachyon]|eukprot:XP_014758818.1 uncharacterized protein LOC104584528 isoform X2 [Brachypodium distachyon]
MGWWCGASGAEGKARKIAPPPLLLLLLVPLLAVGRADAWGKDWSTPLRRAAQKAGPWSPTAGISAAGDTRISFPDALLHQISRDCQELETFIGEQLASLLYLEPHSELTIKQERRSAVQDSSSRWQVDHHMGWRPGS